MYDICRDSGLNRLLTGYARPPDAEPMCGLQAELYIPTIATSAFGIVRAYQKDGTDVETGINAVLFVDSDRLVAQNALEAPVPGVGAGFILLTV